MFKIKFLISFFIVTLTILVNCSGKNDYIKQGFKEFNGKYIVYINKENFTLEVFNRKTEIVAKYRIAYGKNPDKKAKLFSGDNRTPNGKYKINKMLSMDADKSSSSYKEMRSLNNVYFRAKEGHHKFNNPEIDLGKNAYGPRFYSINYPNNKDKKRYQIGLNKGLIKSIDGKIPGIGYGIAIHGNADEASIGYLASSGCIRMYNNDIVALERYIQIGTPVFITSD